MDRRVWYRFQQNRLGLVGLVLSIALLLLAVGAAFLPESLGYAKSSDVLHAPTAKYWLGTDDIGRDLFWRVIRGSSTTLGCGAGAVVISLLFGIPLGLVAGYFGGAIDMIIMRGMDILLAFPSLLLALALMTVFEANLRNAVIAIGLVYVPRFARVIRSSTLQTRDAEFVQASLVTGATTPRLLFRHILPNTLSPILVLATLSLSGAILEIAALSFLGLGATDAPEWGNMLTDAKKYISVHPSMMFYPGLALALSVFGINLLGDGLRDALDVRLKSA
jgi:ABC-type dipeptide/oligopeptide/nickel transport system permease subunit